MTKFSSFNILIDKKLYPSYYDDFQCIGKNCRISCCKNWDIAFDKKDYFALKKLKRSSALSQRIEDSIRRLKGNDTDILYAKFYLKDGNCPLLDESGLCALQLEKGHKALPFVCRNFPRNNIYYFSGYLENSVSTACENVLNLLWELPDGIKFNIAALSDNEIKNLSVDKASPLIYNAHNIQNLCINILQDRRLSLPQRIILMGSRLRELTKNNVDISQWISKTKAILSDNEVVMKYKSINSNSGKTKIMYISNNLHTLLSIAVTETYFKEDFSALINSLMIQENERTSFNENAYFHAESAFFKAFGDKEYFFENLAVNLLFHMKIPNLNSSEELWKSYINFCNFYSILRFVSVLSAKAQLPQSPGANKDELPIPGSKEALFHALVILSRSLIHNQERSNNLRNEFFKNESSSLAHMAILVSG